MHKYYIDWTQHYMEAPTNLSPNLFDRYQNPFERKHTLRDKQNAPQGIDNIFTYLEGLRETLSKYFDVQLMVDDNRHFCGFFKYFPSDKLDVHVDAGIDPITGYRKHVTVLLYLTYGNSLELWDGQLCTLPDPKLSHKILSLDVVPGRLFAFVNDDTAWHGVATNRYTKPRYVATVSFLSDQIEQFENVRERAFFVPRPSQIWDAKKFQLRDKRASNTEYDKAYISA